MATYVNNLRLKEITTGDEDGTWGASTNTNLELIGEALGYGTKQMAADADETFTMPDASADGSRALYLKITSAVSLSTTRVVTLGPNTVSKFWIIENATSGSQDITIKQGSGATVNVPNGNKVYLYTDGAGAGAAVANAEPSSASGGTVTSVGGTGTVNGLTLTGTVTSSGNLTLGGTLANVDLTSAVTGTLPTANGGTSFNSYTQGDVIYASGTNTLAKLPIGGANQVLSVNSGGTALEYTTISAGVATRTASGAISAGDPVAMNSDGTVSTITGAVQSEVFGLQLDAGDTRATQNACAYDPTSNKMMTVYRRNSDNTYYGIVGTVSGQSITFGSPVTTGLPSATNNDKSVLVYNAQEDRFVSFSYDSTANAYRVIAGQIIGTTISWGTAVSMPANTTRLDAVNIDGTSNILVGHVTGSNIQTTVISLSGSTITVNTSVTITGSATNFNVGLCYNADDNEYGFTFNSNNDQYYSFITVSGTTPTATSAVAGQQNAARDSDIVWHRGHQQYISFVFYNNTAAFPSSNYGIECRQFTQSGGTITTINTHNITASANISHYTLLARYEPNSTLVYVTYHPQVNFSGNTYQKQALLPLTINASSIANGELYELGDSNYTSYAGLALDSDNKQILISCSKFNADYNFVQAIRPYFFSSTFNNYFGIANANIADAASGTINILGGVDSNQTGLTAGSKYYVNYDGTLTTRQTPVIAGFAMSSTSLQLLKPSDVLIQRDNKVALTAINAGDAVFVNDDYSCTTFTQNYQWLAPSNSSGTSTHTMAAPRWLQYAGGDNYVMFYRDSSAAQLKVFVWQISGGTWTEGPTITTILSTNGGPRTNNDTFYAIWNPYAECVCYHMATNSNGYQQFGKFSVNAAGTAIENTSTSLDYAGEYGFYPQIAVNPNNGKMVVATYQNSSGNTYYWWWDQSSKTAAVSKGGMPSQTVNSAQGGGACAYMPTHQEFLLLGWNNSNQAVLSTVDATGTGNPGASIATATYSPTGNVYNYAQQNRYMEWSETHQQAIASYAGNSPTPTQLRHAFFSYNGTTISYGSQVDTGDILTAAGGYATAFTSYYNYNPHQMFPILIDGVQHVYMWQYNYFFDFIWTKDGSGNGGLTWVQNRNWSSYSSDQNMTFNPVAFEWARHYESGTSYTIYYASAGTTNATEFIGFADNSAAANQYVLIDTSGGVNANQSGLTAGTSYYIGNDGTLTTSVSDAKAGVALSGSEILVKL